MRGGDNFAFEDDGFGLLDGGDVLGGVSVERDEAGLFADGDGAAPLMVAAMSACLGVAPYLTIVTISSSTVPVPGSYCMSEPAAICGARPLDRPSLKLAKCVAASALPFAMRYGGP